MIHGEAPFLEGQPVGRLRPLILNENFARMRNEKLGIRNEELGMKVAASPRIYMGDARRFAIAGFPRIVSLPLEGKVPQRGG